MPESEFLDAGGSGPFMDLPDPYAAPENPRLPVAGVPIPGSRFGMSPDEFSRLVQQYRQQRFGGGGMTSGQANDPRQLLGQDVYSRIANAPTGFGGVMPMAPSETPPIPMGEPLEQPLVEPGAQFPVSNPTAESVIQRKLRQLRGA